MPREFELTTEFLSDIPELELLSEGFKEAKALSAKQNATKEETAEKWQRVIRDLEGYLEDHKAKPSESLAAVQYMLGFSYKDHWKELGISKRKGIQNAKEYFEQAAASKHTPAIHGLGCLYYYEWEELAPTQSEGLEVAKQHFKHAIDLGDEQSKVALRAILSGAADTHRSIVDPDQAAKYYAATAPDKNPTNMLLDRAQELRQEAKREFVHYNLHPEAKAQLYDRIATLITTVDELQSQYEIRPDSEHTGIYNTLNKSKNVREAYSRLKDDPTATLKDTTSGRGTPDRTDDKARLL